MLAPRAGRIKTGKASFIRRRSRKRSIRWNTDRKGTRLNSSHLVISYAVFCLKKNDPGTCTFNPSSLVPTAGGAAFTVTVGSSTAVAFNFSIQGFVFLLTHSQPGTLPVPPDVALPD